ncbi:unnamed protein product [Echinostoma caproni]|uniref:THAP-type domain-containing protein n=1 Tax=Echinostoma caproni TaxID=27848 RepID=A0A183BEZ3_9TREM|nr:unnamed protein product [Echinostoma caproni]
MRALSIYTKEFMFKIKDVVMKNQTAMFGVPVSSQALKYCKRGNRIRAGWQIALGRTTPNKVTVPTFVSNTVRSVFGKFPDASYMLQREEFRTSCDLRLQASWLNEDVDDSVVQLENFVCFKQNRQRHRKK